MLKIERILCPVDFSEFSLKAYDYAYSLAQHYDSQLLLEHVIEPLAVSYPYDGYPEVLDQIYKDLRVKATERLQELVKTRTNGIQPQLTVSCGPVASSILAFAEDSAADLIVMGTHGRQGIDHLTMGSVTEKVLRKARCPVLAVRKPAHDFVTRDKDSDPVQLRKILFCTDFSKHSERAFDYAVSLAGEYSAEITLLYVIEESIPPKPAVEAVTAEHLGKMAEAVPASLRDCCTIRSEVRFGKPHEEIIRLAQEAQTDLIVMGVRGRNLLDLALFGSTTHRVIQMGSCPVLVIHL